MKLSDRVKPISYLKTHAAEIIRELGEGGEPLILTQRGEAKAILQSLSDYEADRETLAMLVRQVTGQAEIAADQNGPASETLKRSRKRQRI